jgi:hypothetical protein
MTTPLERAYEERPGQHDPASGFDRFRDGWNAALDEALLRVARLATPGSGTTAAMLAIRDLKREREKS